MNFTKDRIYELLPAVSRKRDAEHGYPLKALMEVLAREAGVVEQDIDKLYENWFIETCEEWVVPYIGDLVGARNLQPVRNPKVFTARRHVANTLAYRRRKGTAFVLEQLAYDITGWPSKVVEFFELLSWTQNLNHARSHTPLTVNMRNQSELDRIHTAFEKSSHTVDVRQISRGHGKYNISNIGLFLWRLESYLMEQAVPVDLGTGCYSFHTLGQLAPLFNQAQPEREIAHLAEEINVPGALRRRLLYDELELLRQKITDAGNIPAIEKPGTTFFNKNYEPFKIFVNGAALLPEEITICSLKSCDDPSLIKNYVNAKDKTTKQFNIRAAVDPELGKFKLIAPPVRPTVRVTCSYGFSADLGSGPYNRQSSMECVLKRQLDFQVGVSKTKTSVGNEKIFPTIAQALLEWKKLKSGKVGLICVMDNERYTEGLTIDLVEDSQLIIIAADWPLTDVSETLGQQERVVGHFEANRLRPHIQGNFTIKGFRGSELILNGLLIDGDIIVQPADLQKFVVSHCTVVPRFDQATMAHNGCKLVLSGNSSLQLRLDHSIVGMVDFTTRSERFSAINSIICHQAGISINALGIPVEFSGCTVLGEVRAREIDASNSIFDRLLTIERTQVGCLRYSFIPSGSVVPRQFRCQPDLERQANSGPFPGWLVPSYTSLSYGDPSFAQLDRNCPVQITAGAEGGGEMGAFNLLDQPLRIANLIGAFEEYLGIGLQAGFIYVN